ncbi:DnaJ domain-containing protein [Desulfurella sp.]|uniref:DnaJ domain-containing protein n=1 Tax=Desulfurella sp. TaxID=1962857 RepID=UPI003D1427C4
MIYDFEFRKNIKKKIIYETIAKEILDVWDTKSFYDIKKKYLQLAKKFHPDVNHTESAKKKFQDISLSYKILTQWDDSILNEKFSTVSDFDIKIIKIKANIKNEKQFNQFKGIY